MRPSCYSILFAAAAAFAICRAIVISWLSAPQPHSVKPARRSFVFAATQISLYDVRHVRNEVLQNVLGSGLSLGETNSSRAGSILWSTRSSFAPERWRPQRRPRHGRHPLRKRYPVAPRRWQRRQTPDSRTLRLAPEKTPRKRRRK